MLVPPLAGRTVKHLVDVPLDGQQLVRLPLTLLILIVPGVLLGHQGCSPRILNRLSGVRFVRRIGLSATPERQFDESGNTKIRKFFGCEDIEGYTFEFSC